MNRFGRMILGMCLASAVVLIIAAPSHAAWKTSPTRGEPAASRSGPVADVRSPAIPAGTPSARLPMVFRVLSGAQRLYSRLVKS